MAGSSLATGLDPVAFEAASLPEFVEYVLHHHASPSTLIVCDTREAFVEQLDLALREGHGHVPGVGQNAALSASSQESWHLQSRHSLLTKPSLRFLVAARTLRMVFCPDITHLRAFLATRAAQPQPFEREDLSHGATVALLPLLAILNPVALHKPTSAYSAQGLNRTFGLAVETAHHTNAKLVVAECAFNPNRDLGEDESLDPLWAGDGELHTSTPELLPQQSIWDDEIGILNVTTKRFGAGERGWVGRTVKLRTIVGRWLTFVDLPS